MGEGVGKDSPIVFGQFLFLPPLFQPTLQRPKEALLHKGLSSQMLEAEGYTHYKYDSVPIILQMSSHI